MDLVAPAWKHWSQTSASIVAVLSELYADESLPPVLCAFQEVEPPRMLGQPKKKIIKIKYSQLICKT